MAKFTRDEFREYLESTGALQAMADTLAKLYELEDKPDNPVKFLRENLYTAEELAEMTEKDPEIALAEGFAKMLEDTECTMLLKQHLTEEIFEELRTLSTSFGSTLYDCVRSGFENHDSGVGLYAPDAEAYTVFADIFDPVIDSYHKGFSKDDQHPEFDWGDPKKFTNLDPKNEFVVSTRVRTARSVAGYPFVPRLTEEQYLEIMNTVKDILEQQEGEFKGKFYALEGMDKEVQQQMIDDHFLFKEGDRFLQSAQACRFWPKGRGIYFNDNKDFLVWVNEEDHLRFISMEQTGDLGKIYQRLINGVNSISKSLDLSRHERLGWLSFCPTNLGTAIRASVHIKVPKLAEDMDKFQAIADKYSLQIRGTSGEHTEAVGGIYDISNKRRMGLTEFQAVSEMYNGIAEIIKMEKSLNK